MKKKNREVIDDSNIQFGGSFDEYFEIEEKDSQNYHDVVLKKIENSAAKMLDNCSLFLENTEKYSSDFSILKEMLIMEMIKFYSYGRRIGYDIGKSITVGNNYD